MKNFSTHTVLHIIFMKLKIETKQKIITMYDFKNQIDEH